MSDEKPLRVRVAEAIGWVNVKYHAEDWWGHSGPVKMPWPRVPVLHYDTDWAAIGPLIERLKISVEFTAFTAARGPAYEGMPYWQANRHGQTYRFGETPLIAVCNLILALAEAGKLTPPLTQEAVKP